MKTILVPLDGSSLAEEALPFARLLAPIVGARVLLLSGITGADRAALSAAARGSPAVIDEPIAHSPVCTHCSLASTCRQTDCYLASQAGMLRKSGVEAYADTRTGRRSIRCNG